MTRAIRFAVGLAAACAVSTLQATSGDRNGLAFQAGPASVLQRFLARAEEPPVEYRALRRLEAQNPKFKQSAWMLAWTEYDHANGFRYDVVNEGGSSYIRNKV